MAGGDACLMEIKGEVDGGCRPRNYRLSVSFIGSILRQTPFLNRLHATQPCIRKRSIHLAQVVVIQSIVFLMGVLLQATLILGVQVGTVVLAVAVTIPHT